MKNIFLLFGSFLLLCTACLYNCTHKSSAAMYPNQSSELALLMREMYVDFENLQKAALKNKIPKEDLREKFKKLHTAVPTEEGMKKESYPGMSLAFIKLSDALYEPGNQIEDYNIMVNSCIACHQNHCPGPIPRIKKLLIQN